VAASRGEALHKEIEVVDDVRAGGGTARMRNDSAFLKRADIRLRKVYAYAHKLRFLRRHMLLRGDRKPEDS
jgi:hypothetical protein